MTFTALENGDRGSAVTAQIVQAHESAPGMFLRRRQGDTSLGQDQCPSQFASGFHGPRLLRHRFGTPHLPALAHWPQPVGQSLAVIKLKGAKQAINRARNRWRAGRAQIVHIKLHAGRKANQIAQIDKLMPRRTTQSVQPLTQVCVGTVQRHIRPQQRGQVVACLRAF